MERLTKRLPGGEYEAAGRGEAELLAALGRYEDQYESIELELELVKLNLKDLSAAGKARSATYATLAGSRFMLERYAQAPAGAGRGGLTASGGPPARDGGQGIKKRPAGLPAGHFYARPRRPPA